MSTALCLAAFLAVMVFLLTYLLFYALGSSFDVVRTAVSSPPP